jgi:hypothetical protein
MPAVQSIVLLIQPLIALQEISKSKHLQNSYIAIFIFDKTVFLKSVLRNSFAI